MKYITIQTINQTGIRKYTPKKIQVDCVFGIWAVHQGNDDEDTKPEKNYFITHIPSGFKIDRIGRNKKQAVELTKFLHEKCRLQREDDKYRFSKYIETLIKRHNIGD